MVGIIRSGAGYMPTDPKQPTERLQYLCEATEAKLVLAMKKYVSYARGFSDTVIDAEDVLFGFHDKPNYIYNPDPETHRKSLAYCLFTSGSTGKPKGLMVEHGCLVCYLQHQTPLGYKSNELWRNDISLHLISFTFDVSVAAVWQPITKGATLIVGKPTAWLEPKYIEALINSHQVTHMWAVPSPFSLMLQVMAGQLPPSIRELHLIGEALPVEMARTILKNPNVTLFNEYGPAGDYHSAHLS